MRGQMVALLRVHVVNPMKAFLMDASAVMTRAPLELGGLSDPLTFLNTEALDCSAQLLEHPAYSDRCRNGLIHFDNDLQLMFRGLDLFIIRLQCATYGINKEDSYEIDCYVLPASTDCISGF